MQNAPLHHFWSENDTRPILGERRGPASAAPDFGRGCRTVINKRSSLRTRTIRDAVRYGAAFAR